MDIKMDRKYRVDEQVIQCLDGWARFETRGGTLADRGSFRVSSREDERYDQDLDSYSIIEWCLRQVGHCDDLRRLLLHIHHEGKAIEVFSLTLPGETIPARVWGLGFQNEKRLLEFAYVKFAKAVGRAIEEEARKVREYEDAA
jgi:hypothetical protein